MEAIYRYILLSRLRKEEEEAIKWQIGTCRDRYGNGVKNSRCHFVSLILSFTSTRCQFLGRLLRVDLIKCVSNVRTYPHPSTKRFFDFNEIWYVGRGRRVMHDGMQYDPNHPIQGQGQSHEPSKVGNSAIFNGCLLPMWWGLANDQGLLN